jgi:hypothetical protein
LGPPKERGTRIENRRKNYNNIQFGPSFGGLRGKHNVESFRTEIEDPIVQKT